MNEIRGTSETSDKNFFYWLYYVFFWCFWSSQILLWKDKVRHLYDTYNWGLGIWALVDFIIACFGEFTDAEGKKIKYTNQ